ncbi:helix-turn-helix domain-containing protein [Sphingomonas jatrophae]|uniref:Uncharacterized protein n=1 Tax=Sphingomonas jatrophae TaxID=1166337 RepID=A0A1I6JL15_9SPHN|nr:hypothetical protein [Sphingomonas jatrophae]SFR79676.1 hypothetical protein SAMN05192580_0433 [Sphingomonas jatrophae]
MTAPLTAGGYLTRRRAAAGLSIADVATMLATHTANEGPLASLIARIEQDEVEPSGLLLNQLRGAFAFDHHTYRFLLLGGHAPQLCRICACSWCDPCDDEVAGPCAWSDIDPSLCTHCAARIAAAAATQPERSAREA